MFGPIRNLVFDFDGTLVDTMSQVTEGLGSAIERVIGRRIPEKDLVATFGPAPQAVLAQWVPEDKVLLALQYWREFDKHSGPEFMRAFPEVEELLEFLKKEGFGIAVFTGRDRESTLKILEARGWYQKYFNEENTVCGDDGHAPKPSPEGLNILLKRFSWKAADTLMVGDHPHDMAAGRAASCKTAAALWDMSMIAGNTQRSRFKQAWEKWSADACDVRLQSPRSLMAWLKMP
jgi:HAD superfamily hydrolase (TIGR01549 family)